MNDFEIIKDKINYITYSSEKQIEGIISLIEKDLSEPYSIYTYRYFINNWPELCYMVIFIIIFIINFFFF